MSYAAVTVCSCARPLLCCMCISVSFFFYGISHDNCDSLLDLTSSALVAQSIYYYLVSVPVPLRELPVANSLPISDPSFRFSVSARQCHTVKSTATRPAELFLIHSLRELTAECLLSTIITFMYVFHSCNNLSHQLNDPLVPSCTSYTNCTSVMMLCIWKVVTSSDSVINSKEPWRGNMGVLGCYCKSFQIIHVRSSLTQLQAICFLCATLAFGQ
jgi:hypothetical protein